MMRALHLLLFVLLVSVVSAQAPPQSGCETCKDRGMVACKLCASRNCEAEREFLHCSIATECADCGGTRWRECAFCDRAPQLDLAAQRSAMAAWRETMRPVDEFMGRRDLAHVESRHFILTSDVKKTDAKRATSQHGAAHWLVDQLERQQAEFLVDAGCTDEDFSAKVRVLLWTKESDQQKAASKYTLERSATQAKLMGAQPVISILFGKGRLRSDEELRHALAHQVAHCLLSNVYGGIALMNSNAGWLDEGLALHYEIRYFGTATEWCNIDAKALEAAKIGRFEALVLDGLAGDGALALADVAGLDAVALAPLQRVYAWSYVDCIVRQYRGTLGALAKSLKQRKPVSEALQLALGLSQAEFERAWRDFVKARYTLKPPKK